MAISTNPLAARKTYRPSGKVNAVRLVCLLPLPLLVGAAMAVLVCALFRFGHYYSLFVPAVAALPVAAACYLTVRWSHCRNLWAAVLLGFVAGAVTFLGYFHADFVAQFGPRAATRVDRLPHYIVLRMQTDAEFDKKGQLKQPDVASNWIHFVIDLVIVLTIVIGAAAYRSSRAYCENCSRWMKLAIANVPAGGATMIAQALAANRLADLPECPRELPKGQASSMVTVECCPGAGRQEGCEIYLRLQEHSAGSAWSPQSKVLLNNVQISVEELAVLAARLPALAPIAPLVQPSAASSGVKPPGQAGTPPGHKIRSLASVEPLPQQTSDKVFTKGNTAIAISLSFFPVVSLLAGIGLLVLAWFLRSWLNPADVARLAILLGVLAAGGLALCFGLVVCVVNVDYFNFQYGYACVRNEIQLRPDPLVRPDDPRAVYVEIVPRERWSEIICDRPSDGGFLLVDEASRQLLFEGIKERYRIPVEAIVRCEAECMQPQAGSFAFYITTVQAHVAGPSGVAAGVSSPVLWEAPFLTRPVTFTRYSGRYRRRSSEALRDSIWRLGR